jgi:hypothetical protein
VTRRLRCGNDPRAQLTDGDRQAIAEFRAYLTRRVQEKTMQIRRTADTIHVTLTAEQAAAVRDDLGQIWASKISAAGDQLHSLLESVTTDAADEAQR